MVIDSAPKNIINDTANNISKIKMRTVDLLPIVWTYLGMCDKGTILESDRYMLYLVRESSKDGFCSNYICSNLKIMSYLGTDVTILRVLTLVTKKGLVDSVRLVTFNILKSLLIKACYEWNWKSGTFFSELKMFVFLLGLCFCFKLNQCFAQHCSSFIGSFIDLLLQSLIPTYIHCTGPYPFLRLSGLHISNIVGLCSSIQSVHVLGSTIVSGDGSYN